MSMGPCHPEVPKSVPSRPRRVAGTWTEEEDERLCHLVQMHGEKAWVKVAMGFNDIRDKKQCRERWCNHVNPHINNSPFTPEENMFIIDYYIRHGRQWARMSRTDELAGRPDNAIKNHFNTNLISHYADLCKEYSLPRRQANDIDPIDAATYAVIQGKVSSPTPNPVKGIKSSRFITPFPCRIENLISPTGTRRRADTLQDKQCDSAERAGSAIHCSDSLGLRLYSTSEVSARRPTTRENDSRMGSREGLSDSHSSSYTSSQGGLSEHLARWQVNPTSPLGPEPDLSEWLESDIDVQSPVKTETLVHATQYFTSPSTSKMELKSDDDERLLQTSRWFDANGYYSLPPLTSPRTNTLSKSPWPGQPGFSGIDEQQKALLEGKFRSGGDSPQRDQSVRHHSLRLDMRRLSSYR